MMKRAVLSAIGDVDIRLLRIFVVVSECGGFAASELELNIGRSTISKHIADLEQRVGLKLCNRGPSGFSLTREGEQVLAATSELLARIDDFQTEIDDIHTHLTGTMRIGIFDQSTTNPEARMHEAIRIFDEIAPDVALEIVLDAPGGLEARIMDGSLDTAVVPIHRQSASLKYQELYSERMNLYCGERHPLFGAPHDATASEIDLFRYKYAGYGFNSPNMKAGRGLGLRRSARVKEEEALCLLIQSGKYLGFLADHVAETFVAKREMWAVCPEEASYSTTFGAITRKKPEPDRKTLKFLECLIYAHRGAD
ncbi:MAG: LysR family transcriptional regulator [Pseudomonadota bacterium]